MAEGEKHVTPEELDEIIKRATEAATKGPGSDRVPTMSEIGGEAGDEEEEASSAETGETIKYSNRRHRTDAGPGNNVKVRLSTDQRHAQIQVRVRDRSGEVSFRWEDLKHGYRVYNNPKQPFYQQENKKQFAGAWYWDDNAKNFVRTDPTGESAGGDVLENARKAARKFSGNTLFPNKAAHDDMQQKINNANEDELEILYGQMREFPRRRRGQPQWVGAAEPISTTPTGRPERVPGESVEEFNRRLDAYEQQLREERERIGGRPGTDPRPRPAPADPADARPHGDLPDAATLVARNNRLADHLAPKPRWYEYLTLNPWSHLKLWMRRKARPLIQQYGESWQNYVPAPLMERLRKWYPQALGAVPADRGAGDRRDDRRPAADPARRDPVRAPAPGIPNLRVPPPPGGYPPTYAEPPIPRMPPDTLSDIDTVYNWLPGSEKEYLRARARALREHRRGKFTEAELKNRVTTFTKMSEAWGKLPRWLTLGAGLGITAIGLGATVFASPIALAMSSWVAIPAMALRIGSTAATAGTVAGIATNYLEKRNAKRPALWGSIVGLAAGAGVWFGGKYLAEYFLTNYDRPASGSRPTTLMPGSITEPAPPDTYLGPSDTGRAPYAPSIEPVPAEPLPAPRPEPFPVGPAPAESPPGLVAHPPADATPAPHAPPLAERPTPPATFAPFPEPGPRAEPFPSRPAAPFPVDSGPRAPASAFVPEPIIPDIPAEKWPPPDFWEQQDRWKY